MIVRVDVRIENEPADGGMWGPGNLNFSETANFPAAGFETISKIFSRCHELLDALKTEHKAGVRK